MNGADGDLTRRAQKYPVFANRFFLVYGLWLLAMSAEEFLLRNFAYNEADPIFKWFMLVALVNFALPYLGFGIAVFGWRQKSMLLLAVLLAVKLRIDWLCDGPSSRPWHC